MFRALTVTAAAASLFIGAAAAGQGADPQSAGTRSTDTVPNSALKWREMIPNVVYFAPAYGDWEKGAHAKFARVQPGATVPMHTHKQPYHAVVISGQLTNLLDSGPTRVALGPGDYWYMAGGRAHGHVCTSAEPCLVYTHSDGAWDLALVE